MAHNECRYALKRRTLATKAASIGLCLLGNRALRHAQEQSFWTEEGRCSFDWTFDETDAQTGCDLLTFCALAGVLGRSKTRRLSIIKYKVQLHQYHITQKAADEVH